MSACSGKCCSVFNYPSTPEQLRERWAKWPGTDVGLRDDLFVADMLIPLDSAVAAERAAHYDVAAPEGFDLISWAENTPTYTCRHWDEETMLCTTYEERPLMCRDYPYGRKCQHDCDCGETGCKRETPRKGSDLSGA